MITKRYVPAPDIDLYPKNSTSATNIGILGVWLAENEDVEWHWFGWGIRRVIGYTIVKKMDKRYETTGRQD